MPLRLRVTYARVADFLADARSQIARGGMLVRVDVGAVERGAEVELEIATPVGTARVDARVLQILAGAGVAVELPAASVAQLVKAAEAHGGADAGNPPVHEQVTDAVGAEDEETDEWKSVAQVQAQKIQQALHGDKNQRMAILREPNKMLHSYVLRNPQVQLDEIVFIARSATAGVDLLAFIAGRREWSERPEVAIAIVRNPKSPIPLAIRMLDHVGMTELRNLAKQQSVRDPIQRAARKKILG